MDTEIEKLSKKIDESFNSNIELLDQSLDSLAYQMIQTEELLSIDYEKISTEIESKRTKLKELQLIRQELEETLLSKPSIEETSANISPNKEIKECPLSIDYSLPQTPSTPMDNDIPFEDLVETLTLYTKLSKLKWNYRDPSLISGTLLSPTPVSFKFQFPSSPTYSTVNQLWDFIDRLHK